jgi:hypothetical protein
VTDGANQQAQAAQQAPVQVSAPVDHSRSIR